MKINGITGYLWRAVDQHGNVLDVLVQVAAQMLKQPSGSSVNYSAAPAVCTARAGDRQTGQLRGCSPPAHGVGGPPAVAVS